MAGLKPQRRNRDPWADIEKAMREHYEEYSKEVRDSFSGDIAGQRSVSDEEFRKFVALKVSEHPPQWYQFKPGTVLPSRPGLFESVETPQGPMVYGSPWVLMMYMPTTENGSEWVTRIERVMRAE